MKGPAAAHSKVPGKSSNRRRPIQHPEPFQPMYHRGEFHQRKPLGGRSAPEPSPIATATPRAAIKFGDFMSSAYFGCFPSAWILSMWPVPFMVPRGPAKVASTLWSIQPTEALWIKPTGWFIIKTLRILEIINCSGAVFPSCWSVWRA